MRILHFKPSEDGKLRRQQVWSGRPREAGEFQTTELEGDQCQTRKVVRAIAAKRASLIIL
jgi:hypothetical protein